MINIGNDTDIKVKEAQTSVLDILLVLLKHKKVISIISLGFGVTAALLSLFISNMYKAETKILPPQQNQSTATAMLNQLGGLAAAGAGAALGVKNPNDTYIGMLKSRAIGDPLIQKFDLKNKYNEKFFETTRKEFAKRSTIKSGKDGIITIEVEDNDPVLAKDLANAYVDELVALSVRFFSEEAAQRRSFFEKQLKQAKDNLFDAELLLSTSLEKNGMVSVDAQSKVILETIARLEATIAAKEVHLKSMQPFVTENNSDYKHTNQEIISMRDELLKLKNGVAGGDGEEKGVKKTSLKNIQVLRDVKYYTMLYELLAKQYEIARLDESKNIPTIQVLDKALVPERKYWPTRSLIAIVATFFGLCVGIAYAFISESMNRPKNAEEEEKWKQLRSYLKFK